MQEESSGVIFEGGQHSCQKCFHMNVGYLMSIRSIMSTSQG